MDRFIAGLGISRAEAFANFNLAPLALRRNIGALGFLHKINLDKCHPAFRELFPANPHTAPYATKKAARRHGKQFAERFGGTDYFNHSLFAMTRVYNVLPENIVAARSVKVFQTG